MSDIPDVLSAPPVLSSIRHIAITIACQPSITLPSPSPVNRHPTPPTGHTAPAICEIFPMLPPVAPLIYST